MKLDLGGIGSGKDGFTTINICRPCDKKHNLDIFPYPFKDDSVEEIRMHHTLEHLREPLDVMKEIYRICKNGTEVDIIVPIGKKDAFNDPWHRHQFMMPWFEKLCEFKSVMHTVQSSFWRPFMFDMVNKDYVTGSIRFWKRYGIHVSLRVIK